MNGGRATDRPSRICTPNSYYHLCAGGDLHCPLDELLTINDYVHKNNTRNARDFNLAVHHSTRFQIKPSYVGAKLFNLPPPPTIHHSLSLSPPPPLSVGDYQNKRSFTKNKTKINNSNTVRDYYKIQLLKLQ